MSPSRLMIRQFPDPVTESLSFWKMVNKDPSFSKLANIAFNPQFSERLDYTSLIENPTGLNIVSSSSVENAIKKEIRNSLLRKRWRIKNNYIKAALDYDNMAREPLTQFLMSVNPCFPRFISEFKESTELGLSDTIIGLIQNSRTIRNMFSKNFSDKMRHIVKSGEEFTLMWYLSKLQTRLRNTSSLSIATCTSSHADSLRNESWRRHIVGITLPHPMEYLKRSDSIPTNKEYILCCGMKDTPLHPRQDRGLLKPGLGSRVDFNLAPAPAPEPPVCKSKAPAPAPELYF